MQSDNGALKKGFEEWVMIQLGRDLQKILSSHHEVPQAKISFQKQSAIEASFKQSTSENRKDTRKKLTMEGKI